MGDELTPEDISNTQKILGKYVSKPPLTEKLLKKPPFRFLHDVINTVIRETGFLKGLFTEGELLSDNVKDRESKVAFLNKLITAVKTITGTDLQVRASKIIAGLEPGETNKLLQAIGKAVDDKLDSKEYVNQLKGGKAKEKSKTKDAEKSKKLSSKSSVKSDKSSDSTKVKKSVETPKTKLAAVKESTSKKTLKTDVTSKTKSSSKESINKTDSKKHVKAKDSPRAKQSPRVATKDKKESPRAASKESPRAASKESPRTTSKASPRTTSKESKESPRDKNITNIVSPRASDPLEEDIIKNNEDITEEVHDDGKVEEEVVLKEESKPAEEVKIERPKTAARLKSGNRMQPIVANVAFETPVESTKVPEKRIPEQPVVTRPKSSLLRPPSVRPSSARPGAPRLRPDSALPMKEMIPLGKINVIVENFGDAENKEDDEETVVIQNVIEDIPEPVSIEKSFDMPADKGHLVEQILEQIQGPEQLEEIKEKNNWENENIRGKDATTKEINQLRASIQSLTRTANPLGKLMSYLHEDVEAMHSELESWTNLKNQYTSEINVQRRANSESNQPLINQLQEIEENIKKQREEIANVKFNILRNEEKIRDLISKQAIVQ